MNSVPDTLAGHNAEIDRLVDAIAKVENTDFHGPLRYEVLDILQMSLTLHRKALAELDAGTKRRGD